ncbi:DUF4232 domain-containing protein [Rothia uropygialis]|uniref:DUF4232 domain-containing protein n=1 Tax=Kocuria sp. 36 TaxID=1415402 RepID=UPI00101D9D3F|nr:DUF4232 domain-containing protein [Kocuria sp. 36]
MAHDTTRRFRTSLTGVAVAALLLGVSACSPGGSQGENESASSSGSASSSTSSPAPSSSATSAEPIPGPASSTPAPTPTVTEQSPTQEPSGTSSQAPSEPQPSEPTPTEQAPSSGASSQSPTTQPGAKSTSCADGALKVAVEASGGAAGSTNYTVTFTNSGSDVCKLSGYPSVNFVNDSGQTIGAAAMQATELPGNGATLNPGGSTSAALRSTQADLYGQTCEKTNASGLRITAPGSEQVLDVSFPMSACANGSVQQLSVSKIGVQS